MASLVQILGKGLKKRGLASDDAGSKILLEFDCIVREALDLSSEVSQFPLETGALINDHVRTLPEKLTLDVVISADPVTLAGAAIGSANAALSALIASRAKALKGGQAGAAAGVVAAVGGGELANLALGTNDRIKTAWDALRGAWKARNTLTVVTGFDVYTPMAIVSLSSIRTAENGDDLTFTVSFQKLEIVQGNFGKVNADGSVAHTIAPNKDSGIQPLKDAAQSVYDRASALVNEVQSKIGGLFG